MNFLRKYVTVLFLVISTVGYASLSWSESVSIRAAGRYEEISLSMNELNQAMIIGVSTINDRDVIQASYFSNFWHPVINCSSSGNYYLIEPKVSLNNKKKALAIWRKVMEGGDSIQAACATDGVWSTPVDVINNPGQVIDQQLAFNDAGEGIAVWLNNFNHTLEYATFSDEKWSAPLALTEKTDVFSRPLNIQVAMNQAGEKIVTWMISEEGNLTLYATNSKKEEWSKPQQIGITCDWYKYSLSLNDKGEAILAWIGQYYKTISVATFQNNTWSKPQELAPNEAVAISVSLNNNGNAILTWSDNTVNVMRKFKGKWNQAKVLSSLNKTAEVNKVILNDQEQAVLSFKERDPLDPVPFPLPKPDFGVVVGFSNETWEKPIMIFSKLGKNPSVITAIGLNNHGHTVAVGTNRKGFKVARGSFR